MSPGITDRRGGLANIADIIIAPATAFDRLRAAPTWGWAFLVATLLGIAGTLMILPAVMHAADLTMPATMAATPQIAKLPPSQQARAIANAMKFARIGFQLSWLFIPIGVLLTGAVQAVIMLVANAAGHGDGTFKKFFALSQNVSVIGLGLASLVAGLIVTMRGANSFETLSSVRGVTPSLALLAPGASALTNAFLSAFNVFTIWATVLLAIGMTGVAHIPRIPAWVAAIGMLLGTAALAAFGAARNG